MDLEAAGVTWEFARNFEEKAGITPGTGAGLVEELRRTKDAGELAALREAAAAGDAAFARAGRSAAARAATEADLAWELVAEMRRRGGEQRRLAGDRGRRGGIVDPALRDRPGPAGHAGCCCSTSAASWTATTPT